MVSALFLLVVFAAFVWLVFFRLKLLKFSIAWGVGCSLFGIHSLLIFLIGVGFSAPYSTDARVHREKLVFSNRNATSRLPCSAGRQAIRGPFETRED